MKTAALVRTKSVPGDRRGSYAVITKQGIDLLRRMWPVYARGITTYFEPAVRDGGPLRAALEGIADAASADRQ